MPPKYARKLRSPMFPRKLQSQMAMEIWARKADKPHYSIDITSQTRILLTPELQSLTTISRLHNAHKSHKPITIMKTRRTVATSMEDKPSNNTNIIYTGSNKLSMTRTALERCDRLPFNFEANLYTETSNTLAIRALAKLIGP